MKSIHDLPDGEKVLVGGHEDGSLFVATKEEAIADREPGQRIWEARAQPFSPDLDDMLEDEYLNSDAYWEGYDLSDLETEASKPFWDGMMRQFEEWKKTLTCVKFYAGDELSWERE